MAAANYIPQSLIKRQLVVPSSTGVVVQLIGKEIANGIIRSITIEDRNSAVTTIDVEIWTKGVTPALIDKVYIVAGATLTSFRFYDILDPGQLFDASKGEADGLWLYLKGNTNSDFDVRIDVERNSY